MPNDTATITTTPGSGTTLVGLVAYAAVPFAAAESVTTALWLNALHLAVAAPLLGLLSRDLPSGGS